MALSDQVRRVVTGHDASGKAIVLFDSANPHRRERPDSGTVSRGLWMTDGSPAAIGGGADRAAGIAGIEPPASGSVFRIVDFPSMTPEKIASFSTEFMQGQVGHDDAHGASGPYRPPTHPFMHRTRSIDYAIVMEGEIDMQLDEETIHLRAGDVLVQQGTNHAWINTSGAPCRIAFVLIDAADPFA